MDGKVKGELPRPRVAILGEFEEKDLQSLRSIFPITWEAENLRSLTDQVDPRDVDLLIIGEGIVAKADWSYVEQCHVICFSRSGGTLPGPNEDVLLRIGEEAKTTALRLPDLPLQMNRILGSDLKDTESVRGWNRLSLQYSSNYQGYPGAKDPFPSALNELDRGAIVVEDATRTPLACRYLRTSTSEPPRGVAWLPNALFSRPRWIRAIVEEWGERDPDSLPGLTEWKLDPTWQTPKEREIAISLAVLEEEKQKTLADYDRRLASLEEQLCRERAHADTGLRKLVTAQDDDLVEQVTSSLQDIGFNVREIDKELAEGKPKREDLRLSVSGDSSEWEAIVEVRGYRRSTHKLSDMNARLARFASLYERENGRSPDKRIYIVNGEIGILPPHRQRPLAGCEEDIEEFATDNGLIIWTLELYRALVQLKPSRFHLIREALQNSVGYLDLCSLLPKPSSD